MEKIPLFLNQVGGRDSKVQETPLDNIEKVVVSREELGDLSIRTDKMITRFLQMKEVKRKKTIVKNTHSREKGISNRELRIAETYINNELVRLLYQSKSSTFSEKLKLELKRSISKLQKNNPEYTKNEVEIIFAGAEAVVRAIGILKNSKRLEDLNVKDQFIGTNDSLDASRGIDLMEVLEDKNEEITINLIQVKSNSEGSEKNKQYVAQHREYIESLPDMMRLIVERKIEKEVLDILFEYKKNKPETIPVIIQQIEEILMAIEIGLEKNPNEKNLKTLIDKQNAVYDKNKISAFKKNSQALFLLSEIELIDEERISRVAELCRLEQSEVVEIYSSFKRTGIVKNLKNINSILISGGVVDIVEKITQNPIELVFE
jgi:hypothetical protein